MTAIQDWYLPFEHDNLTLKQALDQLHQFTTGIEDVPLMVRLCDHPALQSNGFNLFDSAVDMEQHDCIHVLLGRGFLLMDEAFGFGFTLGCSKKTTVAEQKLHAFASRSLYPLMPELDADALSILKDAIRLAYMSNCTPLEKFDFSEWLDMPIGKLRQVVGIEPELLRAYFAVEKRRYPQSAASQRLLPNEAKILVS